MAVHADLLYVRTGGQRLRPSGQLDFRQFPHGKEPAVLDCVRTDDYFAVATVRAGD